MKPTKVPSFTLSEMLVVMVITAIVVGMAFSVLTLVHKHVRAIEGNFQKTTELSLFEQRLWQDFNRHNVIVCSKDIISLSSDTDTLRYHFGSGYTLRNNDTIPLELAIEKAYYLGSETRGGYTDALRLSADKELPGYFIFVYTRHDGAHFMNQNHNRNGI